MWSFNSSINMRVWEGAMQVCRNWLWGRATSQRLRTAWEWCNLPLPPSNRDYHWAAEEDKQTTGGDQWTAGRDETSQRRAENGGWQSHGWSIWCVFKMPEYYQHKSSKRGWYSPPFYTHPGGYKMCIRVNANGHDCGEDTHISVFAYLMRGKNDDTLSWPFTRGVTVTLLNQLTDGNHHTRTLIFPQDTKANKKVVDGEKASAGYGMCKFISHNQLDATLNCQYLKDGCLYFRVKVQAAKPMKPWLKCTV